MGIYSALDEQRSGCTYTTDCTSVNALNREIILTNDVSLQRIFYSYATFFNVGLVRFKHKTHLVKGILKYLGRHKHREIDFVTENTVVIPTSCQKYLFICCHKHG